jgi:hypothetical protein
MRLICLPLTLQSQDLDSYNKSAVAIAKKYLALPGKGTTGDRTGRNSIALTNAPGA